MDSHNPDAQNTSRPRHGGGSGAGGREDCWSEGATEMLIEAWGDRFLRLNRGNLRQKDWNDVADAVNARQNGVKPRRTDVQCKNRVDTLKKKYKAEKAKSAPSKWPFYYRLEYLVGTTAAAVKLPSKKAFAQSPPLHKSPTAGAFTIKSRSSTKPNPNPPPVIYTGGSPDLNSSGSNDSALGCGSDDDDDAALLNGGVLRKQGRMDSVDFSEETTYKEMARAILKFGEIYERVESSKQHQMMELEKQRMEFTKDLELQRMNMFMEAQLELEKMKSPTKYTSTAEENNWGNRIDSGPQSEKIIAEMEESSVLKREDFAVIL